MAKEPKEKTEKKVPVKILRGYQCEKAWHPVGEVADFGLEEAKTLIERGIAERADPL
jgi:hypothetical protein